MQRFHHLLTSLAFAAHALLGCGVHHVCHQDSAVEPVEHRCSHHDDLAEHHGDSTTPADHSSPTDRCQHIACSYLTADTVRIDHGDQTVSPLVAPFCAIRTASADVGRADCDPFGKANLFSAPLYVWHCALLI